METSPEWDGDHCCCEKHKDAEPHQLVSTEGAALYLRCLHCNEFFFPEEVKHLKYVRVD